MLHCCRQSHLFTNSFASNAYVSFIYTSDNLCSSGLSNYVSYTERKHEGKVCLFFDIFFHLFQKISLEP